jgi:chromosome segregation ATPase
MKKSKYKREIKSLREKLEEALRSNERYELNAANMKQAHEKEITEKFKDKDSEIAGLKGQVKILDYEKNRLIQENEFLRENSDELQRSENKDLVTIHDYQSHIKKIHLQLSEATEVRT